MSKAHHRAAYSYLFLRVSGFFAFCRSLILLHSHLDKVAKSMRKEDSPYVKLQSNRFNQPERRCGLWQVSYYGKYSSFDAVFQTNEPHFTFHNQSYLLQGFEPVEKIFILFPGRKFFAGWTVVGFHQCLALHLFISPGINFGC